MAKISLRAYNREIETMMDRGQMDEAVAHCHHILKTFPKHLETYRLLGKLYLELKRYNDAVDIFSRVLVADPNDFVSHVGMSIIRDEDSKLDDAVWHMERAFETQPSNAAIQGELQRLYGRRDGVQPPRIRMTRGALAHMYMQGELYPQAISEAKNVLTEDPGRSDMHVLLARAYYKSGQKNDAADAASTLLRRYPYCLDANRVLVEILGGDRPEGAQIYRQRVVELDPYAAQVNGTIFQSKEVSDAAVTIEHFDWNGQPSGMQSDWGSTQAIRLESGSARNEQPDWLKNSSATTFPPLSQPEPTSPSKAFPTFDSSPAPSAPKADDNIPDFLKAAGWGESTGTFDESKLIFQDDAEPSRSSDQPIEQGEMPDWLKAMKPPEAEQPAEDEEMPDWINKIGTGGLSASSAALPASDAPDWMKGFGEEQQPASSPAADDSMDWMKSFGQEEPSTPAPSSNDSMDWMKGFGQEEQQPASSSASGDQPDWLTGFGSETESTPVSTSQPDWMNQLGDEKDVSEGILPSERPSDEMDFLNQLTSTPEQPATPTPQVSSATDTGDLGKSAGEIDDALAWFESLAAKQGATEGLLTKPEERLDEEPDWIKQAKGLNASEPQQPVAQTSVPQTSPAQPTPPPAAPATANVEELGKSENEIDDALAWFEGLAAKQGATEGLLTKPEERMVDREPDWVQQVKNAGNSQSPAMPPSPVVEEPVMSSPEIPVQTPAPVAPTPSANVDELGKSENEIDDALAWFEGLAAKQGATEGLLTKPEERMVDREPDWVQQVKSAGESQPPVIPPVMATPVSEPPAQTPPPVAPASSANVEDLGKSESEIDDALAWFESLAAKQGATEGLLIKPEERMDKEPDWVTQAKDAGAQQSQAPVAQQPEPEMLSTASDTEAWLKGLDDEEDTAPQFEATTNDDTLAWLKGLDEPEDAPIQSAPTDDMPSWMQDISQEEIPAAESAVPVNEAVPAPVDDVPAWLSDLDKDEEPAPSEAKDLPAWLRDETGEVVAEPPKIHPTAPADWKPVVEEKPVQAPPPAPKPAPVQQVEPKPEPPSTPKPKKAATKKTEVKPAAPPQPYREPVTIRGTGMLVMPVDPILDSARAELTRSNIPGALETYEKLIKKGRFLEETIFDLREALYRYPVEVSIWQTLGDAYMRANQLQDALDAYTKAEELLR